MMTDNCVGKARLQFFRRSKGNMKNIKCKKIKSILVWQTIDKGVSYVSMSAVYVEGEL